MVVARTCVAARECDGHACVLVVVEEEAASARVQRQLCAGARDVLAAVGRLVAAVSQPHAARHRLPGRHCKQGVNK